MNFEQQVAQKLLQIKAIKLSPQNPFTWASGLRSPIYCDNRVTLSHPAIRQQIKLGFAALAEQFGDFDAISGVATAGIAHGALLADYLGLPFSYVRSSAKAHGRQNRIEGEITPGSKVLVVEDLISTGGSSIEAVNVLREASIEVVAVAAIFTYQFDRAAQNFTNAKCPFATISNYQAMLAEAVSLEYISEEEQDILQKWSADPEGWYASNF